MAYRKILLVLRLYFAYNKEVYFSKSTRSTFYTKLYHTQYILVRAQVVSEKIIPMYNTVDQPIRRPAFSELHVRCWPLYTLQYQAYLQCAVQVQYKVQVLVPLIRNDLPC
jgi:hypothetical protein